MTNKAILREIRRENQSINRNLMRLTNIGLIGMLGESAKEAKKANDPVRKTLVKAGLLFVIISEITLLIADITGYREEKMEQELEEAGLDSDDNDCD